MPHATNASQGWQIAVTPVRMAYWLNKEHRNALAESIIDLFTNTTPFPAVRARLDAVLTELGVAEARDQLWSDKTEIVRRAQGLASDVLPIRMSDEELDAVLALPTLPTALHARLAGYPEKK
jgi:hypothetical protein